MALPGDVATRPRSSQSFWTAAQWAWLKLQLQGLDWWATCSWRALGQCHACTFRVECVAACPQPHCLACRKHHTCQTHSNATGTCHASIQDHSNATGKRHTSPSHSRSFKSHRKASHFAQPFKIIQEPQESVTLRPAVECHSRSEGRYFSTKKRHTWDGDSRPRSVTGFWENQSHL